MKYFFIFLGLLLLCPRLTASAEPRTMNLTLQEAEDRAVKTSLHVQIAEAQISAASEALKVQKGSRKPRISLDSNYRYLSETAEASFGPATVQFNQHHNYSVGPMLSYELYDGGSDAKAIESVEKFLRAREKEHEGMRLKIILDTRLAYARVQLGIEELRLLDGSIRLVQARLKDSTQRVNLGSASRQDLLAVQREELQLKLRYMQAQDSLAESTRHLGFLIGETHLPETLIPVGAHSKRLVQGMAAANLIIDLDDMNQTQRRLRNGVGTAPNPSHPRLQALDDLTGAARLAGESRDKEALPKVQAFAKSSYDYPNGPLDEKVWQNSVGVSISMTLYDGGMRQGLAAQKYIEAQASQMQKNQVARDFEEAWRNARNRLESMTEQARFARASIEKAEEEARLAYINFQAGSSNYLEVQRANHQLLEARTTMLRVDSQIVSQLANLNYLSAHTEIAP